MSGDIDIDIDNIIEGGLDSLEDLTPSTNSMQSQDDSTEHIDLGSGNIADQLVSEGHLTAVMNSPDEVVDMSISQGSSLQKNLADPTIDDKLLASIRSGDPASAVFNNVLEEIAEELCYLKAFRNTNWDGDLDFSDISAKRIRSLKSLVESLVEREKINNSKNVGKVDFQGKNFENVFSYFLGVIKETFDSCGIPPQFSDIFFTKLAKELDGFEKKAERIYYGKETI